MVAAAHDGIHQLASTTNHRGSTDERLALAFEYRKSVAADARTITQVNMARACGLRQSSVSAWFTGESKTLRGDKLFAAASYLGVSASWLATGVGSMTEGAVVVEPTNVGIALRTLQAALLELPPARREAVGVMLDKLVADQRSWPRKPRPSGLG